MVLLFSFCRCLFLLPRLWSRMISLLDFYCPQAMQQHGERLACCISLCFPWGALFKGVLEDGSKVPSCCLKTWQFLTFILPQDIREVLCTSSVFMFCKHNLKPQAFRVLQFFITFSSKSRRAAHMCNSCAKVYKNDGGKKIYFPWFSNVNNFLLHVPSGWVESLHFCFVLFSWCTTEIPMMQLLLLTVMGAVCIL